MTNPSEPIAAEIRKALPAVFPGSFDEAPAFLK
jgi:hypothetical protein